MNPGSSHPCTVLAFQRVRPEMTADFLRIQDRISTTMSRFPGFLGKEVVRPAPGLQEEWVSVFRFASSEALRHWIESEERRAMILELDSCADGTGRLQVIAGDDEERPPVTVVFSHRVKRGCEARFRAWREEVLHEMSVWPGFLGADVFDPRGAQEEWVLIVRFAAAGNLESWMGSERRAACIVRLEPLIEGYTAHPLGSGLGGWFAFDDAPSAEEPPRWKQILMVTLGLFPTVMLLALFVDPWLEWMPFPVHMLLANLLCVSLLTWPVMPWLNRRFGRWLALRKRGGWRRHAAGAVVVAVLLGVWLALFLAVWPWKFWFPRPA